MSGDTQSVFVEQVDGPEALNQLEFLEEQALIDVPAVSLDLMPFEVKSAYDSDDYWEEIYRVRNDGYDNSRPIRVRPRPGGKWVVEKEDAVRFEAVKKVANEFFTNLLTSKVGKVRFALFALSEDGSYRASSYEFHHGSM